MLALLFTTVKPEAVSHSTEYLIIGTNIILAVTSIALAYITYLVVRVEKEKVVKP